MESMTDTRPTFSRLTEGKARQSWRAALPIVLVIALVVALVGYLASNISSSSQRAAAAERDANQFREQLTAMGKQVGELQKEVALSKSPGRTTVILEAAAPAATGKKKAAAPAAGPKSWAVVTWGELPSGRSWMRANGYGLNQNLEAGKAYHVWMQPAAGDPVDVGALDVDQNGGGFGMGSDLPGIDQGKGVMLTIDASGSKQPGEVVARAELPKLQATMAAGQEAQGQGPAQGAPENQGRSGEETPKMHKEGK